MDKKLVKRYVLLCIPFISGVLLFSLGIYNIVSSLLFFVGGYFVLKNGFDYRKVRENKQIVEYENIRKNISEKSYSENNSVIGLKRTHRYERVRKRVKR